VKIGLAVLEISRAKRE